MRHGESMNRILPRVPGYGAGDGMFQAPFTFVRAYAHVRLRHADTRRNTRERSPYVHAYAPHASARGLVASGPRRPNKGALTPFRREARERERRFILWNGENNGGMRLN